MLLHLKYLNPFLKIQLPIIIASWLCLEIQSHIRRDKIIDSVDTVQMHRNSSFAQRSRLLVQNGIHITNLQYEMRKASYLDDHAGYFIVTPNKKPYIDVIKGLNFSQLLAAFKENIFYRLSQGILWLIISLFADNSFAGILPFRVPYGYKSILQIGLTLENLNSNYVSPLSWYLAVIYLIEDLIGLSYFLCTSGTIFANFFISNPRDSRLIVNVDNSFRFGTMKNAFEYEIMSLNNFVHYFNPHNSEFRAVGVLNKLTGSEY